MVLKFLPRIFATPPAPSRRSLGAHSARGTAACQRASTGNRNWRRFRAAASCTNTHRPQTIADSAEESRASVQRHPPTLPFEAPATATRIPPRACDAVPEGEEGSVRPAAATAMHQGAAGGGTPLGLSLRNMARTSVKWWWVW